MAVRAERHAQDADSQRKLADRQARLLARQLAGSRLFQGAAGGRVRELRAALLKLLEITADGFQRAPAAPTISPGITSMSPSSRPHRGPLRPPAAWSGLLRHLPGCSQPRQRRRPWRHPAVGYRRRSLPARPCRAAPRHRAPCMESRRGHVGVSRPSIGGDLDLGRRVGPLPRHARRHRRRGADLDPSIRGRQSSDPGRRPAPFPCDRRRLAAGTSHTRPVSSLFEAPVAGRREGRHPH